MAGEDPAIYPLRSPAHHRPAPDRTGLGATLHPSGPPRQTARPLAGGSGYRTASYGAWPFGLRPLCATPDACTDRARTIDHLADIKSANVTAYAPFLHSLASSPALQGSLRPKKPIFLTLRVSRVLIKDSEHFFSAKLLNRRRFHSMDLHGTKVG